jgi:hypothetical protein
MVQSGVEREGKGHQMRILVALWRVAVFALLLLIVGLVYRIDRTLTAPPGAPGALPAAAVGPSTAGKSREQVEWERERDAFQRRLWTQMYGPDEAKKLIDQRNASATKSPAQK